MTKPGLAALIAAMACTTTLTILTTPASAGYRSYCCQRSWAPQPRVKRYRYYRSDPYPSGTRYYRANPCGYGDCACIRAYALRTGAQVWWDRYQACAGS